jgi:hypothetical protein
MILNNRPSKQNILNNSNTHNNTHNNSTNQQ